MNVFAVLGAIELLAAAVCAGIALFAGGEARATLLIVALTLAITGFVFRRVGTRLGKLVGIKPDLLDTGERGTATVTAVAETGVTINNDPVFAYTLDVYLPGRSQYSLTVKQRTPRMLMGAILPGARVPVAVDPNNLENVAIDWFAPREASEQPAATPTAADVRAAIPTAERSSISELLETGRRLRARIVSMEDAGDISDLGLVPDTARGGDDRIFVVSLDVMRPGLDPHRATVAHRVPEHLVGRVGPGAEVEVAQDRDDPDDVAIDWAAYEAGDGGR